MRHHIRTQHRHWAAWLLMLAVFCQAFVPALAQAAVGQAQAPWGQICSSSGSSASSADRWTHDQQPGTPADHTQNLHCAYCLLGGAAAPPPPAGLLVLVLPPAPVAMQPLSAAPTLSRSVWLLPPLRAPPRTFA
jgi:hypothetical protein